MTTKAELEKMRFPPLGPAASGFDRIEAGGERELKKYLPWIRGAIVHLYAILDGREPPPAEDDFWFDVCRRLLIPGENHGRR